MSRNRIIVVTIGIMFSLFLASMEATVVATAMPTIVGQLGGLEHYSWVFTAFMLASTTTVPLYGKLSDLYGRKTIYLVGMGLFLAGSIFSGMATNMPQLIAARALQGLGAGGVAPIAFVIIGEMFSLEQRSKMQGVFSGVWGLSSIIGPLLGGFIVDQINWRWIFYINIIPGVLATALVSIGWKDRIRNKERVSIDYAGAFLLTAGVVALLLGLNDLGSSTSWTLIGVAIVLFAALLWAESRAADPILPLSLFKGHRLFSISIIHGVLSGWALFGCVAFIPLFVQSVIGTSATQAGITITPMMLGWTLASIFGTRLMLKIGYYKLAVGGTTLLLVGSFLLARVHADTTQAMVMFILMIMGVGMGISIPPFLIAIQTTVEKRELGTATSTLQFSRAMGETFGVSILGAALSAHLISGFAAAGLDTDLAAKLLDPLAQAQTVNNEARMILAAAISGIFFISLIAAILAWVTVLFTPRIELKDKPELEDSPLPAG
ncbi:MAG: MFS transporter [Anaerolineales bacterium]|nr:MFS transporter [Anaerolineales bacterium]